MLKFFLQCSQRNRSIINVSEKGYLLPAVIVLGLVITSFAAFTLSAVSGNTASFKGQLYDQLANDAAQAGLVAAQACITSASITSTSNSSSTSTSPTVEYLVVGGGGGGAMGGGGGGGVLYDSNYSINYNQAYAVTVGAGGAIRSAGGDSKFDTNIAKGGGSGGRFFAYNNATAGSNGGSGGGAASIYPGTLFLGGLGTSGQGNNGGNNGSGWGSTGGSYVAGGGGGAGQVGANATTAGPGGGGNGVSYFGQTFGGGGGGGFIKERTGNLPGGAGGQGGGGTGGGSGNTTGYVTPTAGTTNTGGGGGGGNDVDATAPAAAGGSGIVILRVADTITATFSAGVTQTLTTANGIKTYRVTAAGTSATVTFSGQSSSSSSAAATGGTVIDYDGFRYHVFTGSGTLNVTSGGQLTVALVGGGGGGGGGHANSGAGAGAGAGGKLVTRTTSLNTGTYNIVVGNAGSGGANGVAGSNGQASTGLSYTAAGGQGGGSGWNGDARIGLGGTTGGSAGGGRGLAGSQGGANGGGWDDAASLIGAFLSAGQGGNAGGFSPYGANYAGGGGGGGVTVNLTGVTAISGANGSGDGTYYANNPGKGFGGVGYGGGGGGATGPSTGGAGAKGIVIVRYNLQSSTADTLSFLGGTLSPDSDCSGDIINNQNKSPFVLNDTARKVTSTYSVTAETPSSSGATLLVSKGTVSVGGNIVATKYARKKVALVTDGNMASSPIGVTGGTTVNLSGYCYHVFKTSGTFTVGTARTMQTVVVGGGAGGASAAYSGGGGGGKLVTNSGTVAAGTYSITVGAGGAAGNNGGTSTALGLTAGGGGTGSGNNGGTGGGSGGGSGGSGGYNAGSGGSSGSAGIAAGGGSGGAAGGWSDGASLLGTFISAGSGGGVSPTTWSGGGGGGGVVVSPTLATAVNGSNGLGSWPGIGGQGYGGGGGGNYNGGGGGGAPGIVIIRYSSTTCADTPNTDNGGSASGPVTVDNVGTYSYTDNNSSGNYNITVDVSQPNGTIIVATGGSAAPSSVTSTVTFTKLVTNTSGANLYYATGVPGPATYTINIGSGVRYGYAGAVSFKNVNTVEVIANNNGSTSHTATRSSDSQMVIQTGYYGSVTSDITQWSYVNSEPLLQMWLRRPYRGGGGLSRITADAGLSVPMSFAISGAGTTNLLTARLSP